MLPSCRAVVMQSCDCLRDQSNMANYDSKERRDFKHDAATKEEAWKGARLHRLL